MYKYSSDKAALEGDVTGTYIEKVSKSTSFHYGNVVLFFFILYLALGNASRIGQFLPTGGYPVAELLLYVAVFPLYLLDKIRLPRPLWLVIFFFSISWILGWIQNIDELGIAEVGLALGYVLRLVGILLVTNYIGFLFHRKFSPLKIIHLFLCLASVQVFIGLVFYVIFPQAEVMWSLLARYGIVFYGDPHVKRLVGPVFDPNFFGNLLVLPATIALAQLTLMRKRRKIYFAYFLLFVVAILLTVSRSSLIGFGMSILTLAFLMLRKDPILYFRFLVRGSVLLGVIVLGMFSFSQVPE